MQIRTVLMLSILILPLEHFPIRKWSWCDCRVVVNTINFPDLLAVLAVYPWFVITIMEQNTLYQLGSTT